MKKIPWLKFVAIISIMLLIVAALIIQYFTMAMKPETESVVDVSIIGAGIAAMVSIVNKKDDA